MGLDIDFYEHAERLAGHDLSDECWDGECGHTVAYVTSNFPVTERETEPTGCWKISGRTGYWHSSYSGVSNFRAFLVRLVRRRPRQYGRPGATQEGLERTRS